MTSKQTPSVLDPTLIFILTLAALLRAQYLTQPLTDWFCWREASTAMMADNLPRNKWNPLWPEVSWTGDQPGYQGREFQLLTIFAAMLNKLFGWQDWHGRLIAVLCGVQSVLALHQIVLHLYGVAEARAAAFILAVMPGAIVIDSSYLPDPAMLALVTTSLWSLIVGMQRKKALLLVIGGLLGTLAMLAKLPALAFLPAAAYLVWSEIRRPTNRTKWLIVGAAFALVLIPVIGYYRWAIYLGKTYPPFHVAGSGWLWEDGFSKFWSNIFFLSKFKYHATAWLWTWPIIILFVAGALLPPQYAHNQYCTSQTRPSSTAPLILFHVGLAGCALFYFVAARELTDNPWNFHIFNPAIAALSGRGLLWIGTGGRKEFNIGVWLRVGAVSFLALYAGYSGSKIPKMNVATDDYLLGTHLAKISDPGDLVVVSGSDAGNPLAIYYSRRRGWIFPPPPQQPDYMYYMDDGVPSIEVFEELRRRGARWFGVVKRARDYTTPERLFLQHHTQMLLHVANSSELVVDTPSYLIYFLGGGR